MKHRIALCCCAALAAPAFAQTYPARPIRMLVGFTPGGTTDVVARIVAHGMSDGLGKPVVIDNRPGAGANIAAEVAAKSPADGYTTLAVNPGLAISASAYAKLGYNALRDLAPVARMADSAHLLIVHPSLPVRSIKDLIALARAKPGALNFCSAGNGSGSHLAGELFKTMTKTDITHVPYKGSGPAIVDLLGGQVQLMFAGMVPIEPHVKSGRLRGIAVSSSKRAAAMPQFPTVAESGLPGFEVVPWYAFVAPAKTPKAIVDVLHREIVNALQTPDIRDKLAREGAEAVGSSPAEFGAYLKADVARWAAVIRKSGAKVD
jgi:tripartite-type tricarboxylate transporter receptor subunit TctC